MKTRLTIAIVWAALAGTLTFVAASSVKREKVAAADALPAYEVVSTARSMGFNPITEPVRRGPYYVLNATDPRGAEVRVVADAQVDEILSVAPVQASTPRYERGPRIIHVPQPGEYNNRANASVNDRDEPAASNDDNDDDVAPPPHRRVTPALRVAPRTTPRWPPQEKRSNAPPPDSRRAVLRPPVDDGPTPIRPTPKFNAKAESAKADSGEKFGPPRNITSSPPPPPIGYTPPAALPAPAEETDSEK